MPETVIVDASCFIILSNIRELDILQRTYGTVVTTTAVLREFGQPLPDWVVVRDPSYSSFGDPIQNLGKGETSAIALGIEIVDSVIVLDDQKARRLAEQMGLSVTGTLGVFIRAKANGVIPSVKPQIEKMRRTNFRISNTIELEALQKAGEN